MRSPLRLCDAEPRCRGLLCLAARPTRTGSSLGGPTASLRVRIASRRWMLVRTLLTPVVRETCSRATSTPRKTFVVTFVPQQAHFLLLRVFHFMCAPPRRGLGAVWASIFAREVFVWHILRLRRHFRMYFCLLFADTKSRIAIRDLWPRNLDLFGLSSAPQIAFGCVCWARFMATFDSFLLRSCEPAMPGLRSGIASFELG